MKQSLLIILVLIFIVICIVSLNILNLNTQKKELKIQNLEYEKYLNKRIYGTDVATLISKAVDQNEKNKVQKNEQGLYEDNKENSIKIDLKMVTINKTYPMEEIFNSKIANFVQNFNLIEFKCTNIEYHPKTGKVSRMVFEEQV